MERSTCQDPSRFEYAVRVAVEPINITVLLGASGWIRPMRARNAGSRAGRQNRLERSSKVNRAGRIGMIDRVTKARGRDRGRIVKRRTVETGITEVNRTTDIQEESHSRLGARRQNQGRLTRNTLRSLNAIVS